MDSILGFLVGLGLSAACGFRVFTPLLIASIAARTDHISLDPSFAWLAQDAALVALAIATVLEIGAYYVPWVDNLLDTVATPAAVIAGTLMMSMAIGDIDPFLRWSIAVIAGGGISGTVQVTTSMTRLASTATTGGLANPVVSTVEDILAVVTSILALALPFVTTIALVIVITLMGKKLYRRWLDPTENKTPPTLV